VASGTVEVVVAMAVNWALAVTGKGGVGKTTLAALAIRWLVEQSRGPILAVDADPNSCLDAMLGVEVASTVGRVREDAKQLAQAGLAAGVSKEQWLDIKIQESMVEAEAFDMIAMGRPEGPGCYCYANNVLRGVLDRLAGHYRCVVIDNEAGLENLSRRTFQKVDQMVFVTDPSAPGLTTTRRLYDLCREMGVGAGAMGVVVNRARNERCLGRARALFAGTAVRILGVLPEDAEVAEQSMLGGPVFGLSPENAVYKGIGAILSRATQENSL
jgi:CO dehydrogenase maturation factor